MIIPHDSLSPDALNGIIKEYVLQEGTDYGIVEFSLEQKITQVLKALERGDGVVVFDAESESCNIMLRKDPGFAAAVRGISGS
jgi:uncharacterized protein YheU (UPF0270 family)